MINFHSIIKTKSHFNSSLKLIVNILYLIYINYTYLLFIPGFELNLFIKFNRIRSMTDNVETLRSALNESKILEVEHLHLFY